MLKIKDWPSFQSYKDRNPPWIRLHKRLLDNYDFQKMSPDARALLPMLWLIASEDKDPKSGLIRDSYESVSFRLRQPLKVVISAIKEIVNAGFIEESDSYGSVTDLSRICHPETETETETERGPLVEMPISDKDWKAFSEMRKKIKKPMTDRAESLLIAKLNKFKSMGYDPTEILNTSLINAWQDFYEPKSKAGKPKIDRQAEENFKIQKAMLEMK